MAVNKVIINGTDGESVLIDLSEDSVTPETLLEGVTAHSKSGEVIEGAIPNKGAVSTALTPVKFKYTIPLGYHDGTGEVGAIHYPTQTVTPTKETQTLKSNVAFMTEVIVNPIPDQYQDITPVTATAEDVLSGKKIVDSDGNVVEGAMVNNGAVVETLTPSNVNFTIPEGYHDGTGRVQINPTMKEVTPTKNHQLIESPDNMVIGNVLVYPIPDQYQDVTPVTATAADVASGKVFVDSTGAVVTGTAEVGGGGEYYTFVNNTGIDLIILGNIVAAGATVDIPVNTEAFSQYGYLLVTSSPLNPATPQGGYIVATVDGVVPPLAAKNLLVNISQPFATSSSYRIYTSNIELIMSTGSTIVVPGSGSTIVLTLSS